MRAAFLIPAALAPTPAMAQDLTPIIDARLRYEGVEQAGIARDAEALTLRLRAGAELRRGNFALLAEGEGTAALVERYNSTTNARLAYPLVPDAQNAELNRLQLQYRGLPKTLLTAGRQRINLDDQRFVGGVAWRQNEQTFDAVRLESAALGPLTLDFTYASAVQTIYGADSAIARIRGDNVFANAGVKLGPVSAKGFAYLVDQDAPGRRQFSSQTFGLRAAGSWPLGAAKLALTGSYARQSDWASNPNRYAADYWLGEGQLLGKRWNLTAGHERLAPGFQTPLATLHKFQGWADKFLVTPPDGIRDLYAGGGTTLRGVSLQAAWHRFDSDRNVRRYGEEWNAQLGFKPMKRVAALVKYADYRAASFATDTRKLWLQLDYSL